MRVAFVGIKRPFLPIPEEIGITRDTFVRYHLELPYYFGLRGDNQCFVSTVDFGHSDPATSPEESSDPDEHHSALFDYDFMGYDRGAYLVQEEWIRSGGWICDRMDVVVHWRSWQQWAHDACPNAIHLIQTCDHSYSQEWRDAVEGAYRSGALSGIICFETWHLRRLRAELELPVTAFLTNIHLGVDTRVYRPKEKDPFQLLWASDPGRGLSRCLDVFAALYRRDRRYRLHVTYPDYVKERPAVSHPGVKIHHNLRNGPALWDLFNTSMFVPYPATFMEPSSRVHRQGQSAGCCVVYPPDAGSPSELIQSGRTGYVIPYDADGWAAHIDLIRDIGAADEVGRCARMFALTEDWSVQAQRFNLTCQELLERKEDGHQ